MAGNFFNNSFSPNSSAGFSFSQQKTAQVKKSEPKKQQVQRQASEINPFTVDDLFKFKKENILYDRVMKSAEMLGFLRAQKVAHQFINLTEPEHQVGKKLNLQV